MSFEVLSRTTFDSDYILSAWYARRNITSHPLVSVKAVILTVCALTLALLWYTCPGLRPFSGRMLVRSFKPLDDDHAVRLAKLEEVLLSMQPPPSPTSFTIQAAASSPTVLENFASRAKGATILSHLTSPRSTSVLFGVFKPKHSEWFAIEDGVQDEFCWLFPGHSGQLAIALADVINISHVTVTHRPCEPPS